MIDSILNFIFPVACVVCGSPVPKRRWGAACPNCWQALQAIPQPVCPKCGLPVAAIEGLCGRCRLGENSFDFARSAVLFDKLARQLVHHLKYSDRVSLAAPMGDLLGALLHTEHFEGDLLIPVPLHPSRQRERGYNQAELIAKRVGLVVDSGLVRRRKKTAPQAGLSRTDRARNLSAAFELRGNLGGSRVILVDDVFTTGATMNEISRVLKRGGAIRVEVLTFARVPDAFSR